MKWVTILPNVVRHVGLDNVARRESRNERLGCSGRDSRRTMTLNTKPAEESEHEEPYKLSRKELSKQFRHEAYLRAKEYRKTDPRKIAIVSGSTTIKGPAQQNRSSVRSNPKYQNTKRLG